MEETMMTKQDVYAIPDSVVLIRRMWAGKQKTNKNKNSTCESYRESNVMRETQVSAGAESERDIHRRVWNKTFFYPGNGDLCRMIMENIIITAILSLLNLLTNGSMPCRSFIKHL